VLRATRDRGFTLIEAAVVMAIVSILATLAYSYLGAARPRAQLADAAAELQAILFRARQEALARGRDVAVVFYPGAPSAQDGVGQIFLVVDATTGFMRGTAPAGAVDYCTMTPTRTPEVLARIDLPPNLRLATPTRSVALPFPYSAVPAPANGCSFCTGTLPAPASSRGAVRFDSRGRVAFFADCGAPIDQPNGGSIALTNADMRGSRVLAIPPTGGVRAFNFE